jgi:hypothetical protein
MFGTKILLINFIFCFSKDVLSVIGSPNNVYYTTDDKIKILNPSPTNSSSQRSQDKSDFYYNYVNFGMV